MDPSLCHGSPVRAHVPQAVTPQSTEYTTTFSLPISANPSFHFQNYSGTSFRSLSEFRCTTADYCIERRRSGDSFIYTVRANAPFQIRNGRETRSITTTSTPTVTTPEPSPTLALPASTAVTATFNRERWEAFASQVATLRSNVESSGNRELTETIDRQLAALRRLVEGGITQSNLAAFTAARDALNRSLQLGSLNIREVSVDAPGWQLRPTAFRFELPAEADGSAPAPRIVLSGGQTQELGAFGSAPFPDSAGREWSISTGNSVLVSRQRLSDGSYQYQVYLREDFRGGIHIEQRSSAGDNITITATASGMTITPTWNQDRLQPFGPTSYPERVPQLRVPSDLVQLLPPLVTPEWEAFRRDVERLQEQLESNGNPALRENIRNAMSLYQWYAFGETAADPGLVSEARSNLERLLAQTGTSGQTTLVATGEYMVQRTRCGSQYVPIYRHVTTPGITAPHIPEIPPPRLLPQLPRDTPGLTGEYGSLAEIESRSRRLTVESSTRTGTFRLEGSDTDFHYFLTPRSQAQGGGFTLEFDVPGEGGRLQRVRYEINGSGDFASHPTIRPADDSYPMNARAFTPPHNPDSPSPASYAHRNYVGNILERISLGLPPPRSAL